MRPDEYLACSIRGARGLYLVYAGGWAVDWPVRRPDGSVAYDWPERVPVRLKRLVAKALCKEVS